MANAKAEAQKNATTETAGATSEIGTEVKSENANTNENLSSSENTDNDIWEKGVTEADRKAATEARKQAAELDAYCKEKIKDYEHLSAANKTMVRDVVREARAKGLSDADALSYARVSARSGLDIAFDKAACLAYDKDGNAVLDTEGNEVYHAGYYDPNENKIVVNPETTKKHAALLIHELSHATRAFSTKDGKIHYIFDKTAYEKISEDMQKQLLSYYSKQGVDVSLYELIGDEATAYYAEELFGTERAVELLLGEKPTLSEKILSFFKGAARDYAADPKLAKEARRQLRQFKTLFDSFAARNFGRNAEGVNENVGKSAKRAAMEVENTKKITANMTDEQRYEILKDKKITAPFYRGEADELIAKEIEGKTGNFAKKAIVTIANKLGIVGSEINFKDVDVEITISNSNLRESLSKKATPEQIAKLLPVLAATAENAIAIERHYNRYHYDTDTVYFDNLVGAYIDEDDLVPVRFGLKHSKSEATTLYVVVDQNKVALENLVEIKSDRGHQDTSSSKEESSNLRRSVKYSISQIIPFVNSKDLLRYLPDGMLSENQRVAKWEAIAETIKKTTEKNDKKYAEYIEKGNLIAAKQMVASAAKAAGYTIKAYHGTNADFTVFDLTKSGANFGKVSEGLFFFTDKKQAYPNSAKDYARYAVQTKGGEEKIYEVYLKIQKPLIVDSQRSYDPVSHFDLNAEKIYDRYFEGDYDGINVKDSTGKKSESTLYILDNAQQIKSADPVTYDDNGKVIPLSERFNSKKSDIRYSMEPTATESEAKAELPRKAARADMTVGQLKKYLANFSRAKTYSRKDALNVVGKIDAGNALTEKTRGDIAEAIWQIYNEALTSTERQAAARDIARYFTLKLFSESKVENPDAKKAEEDLVYLSAGIGSLYFTEEQKNEIKHREDAGWLRKKILKHKKWAKIAI